MNLAVPIDAGDHVLGAATAKLTLVEYGDFECPNCRQAAPALRSLVERHPGKLRLVWRNFPLEAVHPHALHAALAAEAAAGQGKFWPMHDLLLENQSHLKAQHLRRYAEQLELDMARFDAEMSDEIYLQRVREHIDSGTKCGARGAPTVFLGGVIQDISFGLQRLHDRVETVLRH